MCRPWLSARVCCLFLTLACVSPALASTSIMPLGDSITEGAGVGDTGSGYRDTLFTDLNEADESFTFTGVRDDDASAQLIAAGDQYHNGSSGYLLGDIYNNLAGAAPPARGNDAVSNLGGYWLTGGNGTGRGAVDPGIVLLLGGTNDLFIADTLSLMETNMDNILTWFSDNRPDTRVIVGTVIPYQQNQYASEDAATIQAKNAECNAFNSWLESTEVPRFGNDQLVDLNSLFYNGNGTINESLYSTDGLHPDAAGYQAIGNAWAQVVEADLVPEPGAEALLAAGAGLLAIYVLRTNKPGLIPARAAKPVYAVCRLNARCPPRNDAPGLAGSNH